MSVLGAADFRELAARFIALAEEAEAKEVPKVELPTEPCTVIAATVTSLVGEFPANWRWSLLLHSGEWRTPEGVVVDPTHIKNWEIQAERRAATAEAVLARVSYLAETENRFISDIIRDVEKEFGVTW